MSFFGFNPRQTSAFSEENPSPFNVSPFYSARSRWDKLDAQEKSPINIRNRIDRLIPQYDLAARMRALIEKQLDMLQIYIVEPIWTYSRMLNINLASGVWLDRIGTRLGLPRPLGSHIRNLDVFGFDGQKLEGFYNAPFESANKISLGRVGIKDQIYKALLRSRVIALRVQPNVAGLSKCLTALVDDFYLKRQAYNHISISHRHDRTVTVWIHSPKIVPYNILYALRMLRDKNIREQVIPLPPATLFELKITIDG